MGFVAGMFYLNPTQALAWPIDTRHRSLDFSKKLNENTEALNAVLYQK